MHKINEPRYFVADQCRYLVMSIDFFASNAAIVEDLLYKYGFDTKKTVTRIDDPDQDVVTFVQHLNDGGEDEEFYFRGSRARSNH